MGILDTVARWAIGNREAELSVREALVGSRERILRLREWAFEEMVSAARCIVCGAASREEFRWYSVTKVGLERSKHYCSKVCFEKR
jgi:succinate dehydrogenase/fumarate reductase flavoprotein subunit